MTGRPARLVLGPLLRHVGERDATVWVETDGQCTVEVLGHREDTWTVAGHHYALVCVEGLEPGSCTPYDVRLDGAPAYPETDRTLPPPRIRTLGGDGPVRVVFGSCRYARPDAVADNDKFEADALDTYAKRMTEQPEERWPDALLLLGDQVYADETSAQTRERIRARRDISRPPYEQVRDFEEYTWLYEESWTDPDVRWLLATIPSSMIFDDHDVADDWNTSAQWRRDMARTSWWADRVIGGLSSYWVYQHIGNLSPATLAKDGLYQRVREHGGDCEPMLREFAAAADKEADGHKGAQWSYRRDLGHARLLVIDSRCGRILDEGDRSMVSEAEFQWIEDQVEGSYDHLLVGTSLPWLLARALHDVEAWNEALASGVRGERMARIAERFRRRADLEHWAAFRKSFDRLAELFACVGRGEHAGSDGRPPASVCVLSGDVHHAYVAEAHYPDPSVRSRVYQLTCSPVHNYVPRAMQLAFRLGWSRAAEATMRFLLDRVSRLPRQPLTWSRVAGPYYGNEIATLTLDGASARLVVERARLGADGTAGLTPVLDLPLT
ncbi:MAG: alkaline phosphatase D family protein [Actinomycetes bacterium]